MSAVAPIGLGYNIKTTNIQPQFNIDGDTLYVGGDGPNNYTTIQSAIDDAVDGNTVFVYDIQPGVSWLKTFGLSEYHDYIESVFQTSDDGLIEVIELS